MSPRRNQSSSPTTAGTCTFFVVTSGKPAARSKRIWCPKTLSVPVPVRSPFSRPLVEHALEEIEVLPHAADGTRAVGWAYCGSFVTRRTNESVAAPTRPVTRQQPTVRNVTPVGWKPSRP